MNALRRDRLLRDQRGAIYVEMLIVLIPFLTFFLLLVQLVLAFSARIATQHAAWSAARSAIVVLNEERPLPIAAGGDELDATVRALGGTPTMADLGGDWRLRAIRSDASARLMSVSPPLGAVTGATERSVKLALGGDAAGIARLSGAAAYTRHAVGVSYQAGDQVTVRVTYLMHCAIPLGDLFLCRGADGLGGVSGTAAPPGALAAGGARFAILEAEATLPNQRQNRANASAPGIDVFEVGVVGTP